MGYRTLNYVLNPLGFSEKSDVEHLSGLLHAQGVPSRFELVAHRRRGAWSSTIPVGAFDGDFRPDARTWDQHTASRDRVTSLARAALAGDGSRRRRAIPLRHDVLPHDGALFYHPEALRVYAQHVEQGGGFFLALARFLEAAEKDPSLIVPRTRAPFVPLADREARFGKVVRGPDWEPDEDRVLRQWFGQRTVGEHAGRHVRLSDKEWQVVLAALPRRNRNGVRNRLVELNAPLKREMLRNGFVSQDRVAEYMARVLGERPRVPLRPSRRRHARATP